MRDSAIRGHVRGTVKWRVVRLDPQGSVVPILQVRRRRRHNRNGLLGAGWRRSVMHGYCFFLCVAFGLPSLRTVVARGLSAYGGCVAIASRSLVRSYASSRSSMRSLSCIIAHHLCPNAPAARPARSTRSAVIRVASRTISGMYFIWQPALDFDAPINGLRMRCNHDFFCRRWISATASMYLSCHSAKRTV